jgi:hypothetical protein
MLPVKWVLDLKEAERVRLSRNWTNYSPTAHPLRSETLGASDGYSATTKHPSFRDMLATTQA